MRKKNTFTQEVDFASPLAELSILLYLLMLFRKFKFQTFFKKRHCLKKQEFENNIYQTQFFSVKQCGQLCRVTKYIHSFVQIAETYFTNQYIKSTARSSISIVRSVSNCNISFLWSSSLIQPQKQSIRVGVALKMAQFQQSFV